MINRVHSENTKSFLEVCKIEPIFGSIISTAFRTFSYENQFHKFYIHEPLCSTAIYISGNKAIISSDNRINPLEFSEFLKVQNIKELSTNYEQCQALKEILGGEMESSYFMKYEGSPPPNLSCEDIAPTRNIDAVFDILKASHEYYRQHLHYEEWASNIKAKLQKGNAFLVVLIKDGEAIGTGSIVAENEDCGILGEIAVIPKERNKGYGKNITFYLTTYILKKGKTPMLISGYDEVAELYRKIGYKEFGRWGDLFL